ncbi:MAG: F0F1 ATP synthase subunit delta, partial [Saprospiraceae bacterium]
AAPLHDAALSAIKVTLLSSNITMDSLEIISKVNPDIIGGFVIEVGDKLYDASVSHKLDLLRKDFSENQYVKSF